MAEIRDDNAQRIIPLVTELSPSDILTKEDLEIIFNLPDEDIDRISSLISRQYGASKREGVVTYLINRLAPNNVSNDEPFGLNESERLMLDGYIRARDIDAIYDIIINRSSPTHRLNTSIYDDFKYVDAFGHYRGKFIPMPDMTKPPYALTRKEMQLAPHDKDKNGKETNSALFAYLTNTRGLSYETVRWLVDTNQIYQGVYDRILTKNGKWMTFEEMYARDPYGKSKIKKAIKKPICVINGLGKDINGNYTVAYQSFRECWDVWDERHTSPDIKPDVLYEGSWKKKDGNWEFTPAIKKEKVLDEHGLPVNDADGKHVYRDVYDSNGKPVYQTKSPLKRDNFNSDKRCSWRYVNPKSHNLIIFEAPLDCFSYIDMCVQQQKLYTPNNKVDTSKFPNYLTLGGLNREPIRAFFAENPDVNITKVHICLDNDKAGVKAAKELREWMMEQFNLPSNAVVRFNCPTGYQKLDIHGYGMVDEKGNPVLVKDYNELLRVWNKAGKDWNNINKIGTAYAKENAVGKYGTKEYLATQETAKVYKELISNLPGGKSNYDSIPPVPTKRGGLLTADLYRVEQRENLRTSIVDQIRSDSVSAKDKYLSMSNKNAVSTPSADVDIPQNNEEKPLVKDGDVR